MTLFDNLRYIEKTLYDTLFCAITVEEECVLSNWKMLWILQGNYCCDSKVAELAHREEGMTLDRALDI